MTFSSILCFVVVCALVSRCTAATQFDVAFQIALEDALVEGGCSDCTRPSNCITTRFSFSAGVIQCNDDGEVIDLTISPTFSDDSASIGNLTSFDTSTFLIGDTGLSFVVDGNSQLATLNISAATSINK